MKTGKSFRIKNVVFVMLGILVMVISVAGNSYAQKKKKKKVQPKWTLKLAVKPTYDDNILKYSTKYLNRFMNREDEGRFHINRYDDLMIGYSVDISYSNVFIGGVKTILKTGADYNAYSYNSVKSWFKYNIGLRQYIFGSTSFYIAYTFIPSFYVRHFRDDDWTGYYGYTPETFQPYEFSKDSYDFWFQHSPIKNTRVRLYFSYMKYFLDENNTEYDSNDFLYGIKIFQKITSDLSVSAGYKFVTSDAKGFDEPGETKSTSDDVDATFHEHRYAAGLKFKFPKVFGFNNDVSVSGQYIRRFYLTDHFLELDPIHSGRNDYNYRLYINYTMDLFRNFSITAFLNWIFRDSDTSAEENKEYLSDEKDYNQYQTGLKFNYNLKF